MGITLYKPGTKNIVRGIECEAKTFDENYFQGAIKEGWKLSPEKCYEDVEETEDPEVTEPINFFGGPPTLLKRNAEMSDKDIRARAKEMKIPNWHTKSIKRLKVEIEA